MAKPSVALIAALTLALASCGGGGSGSSSDQASTPAPPDVVRFCSGHGGGWHALTAGQVRAAALGTGPAVVLLNESDNDVCAWMAEARQLAARGFRVVVFRYADAWDERGSLRETVAVLDAARDGGRAQLMGASIGGRIVFMAAARHPDGLAAIVSLSGERQVQNLPDIRAAVARVKVPVLYVGSRQDPLTDRVRQPRQLRAILISRSKRFVLVPGAEHGVQLLHGGTVVRPRINAFLNAHR